MTDTFVKRRYFLLFVRKSVMILAASYLEENYFYLSQNQYKNSYITCFSKNIIS